MKNITDFIIESNFDVNSKVRMGDSATLANFIKSNVENLDGSIKVTGDGIKYNNMLVPGTKLSLGLTAGEYMNIFVKWINDYNEKHNKANEKVTIKKTRKNAGVPRGNYGAAEKMKQRADDRNTSIMKGDYNPSAYER